LGGWGRAGNSRRAPRAAASDLGASPSGLRPQPPAVPASTLDTHSLALRARMPGVLPAIEPGLIPAPLEPRESGRRVASECLINDRDVPRSSAADLLRRRDESRQRLPGGRRRNLGAQFSYYPYIQNALIFRFHESAHAVWCPHFGWIILSRFDLRFLARFFGAFTVCKCNKAWTRRSTGNMRRQYRMCVSCRIQ